MTYFSISISTIQTYFLSSVCFTLRVRLFYYQQKKTFRFLDCARVLRRSGHLAHFLRLTPDANVRRRFVKVPNAHLMHNSEHFRDHVAYELFHIYSVRWRKINRCVVSKFDSLPFSRQFAGNFIYTIHRWKLLIFIPNESEKKTTQNIKCIP